MEKTAGRKRVPQTVIIIMCWLVYSLSYLGRYSYNSNITLIIDDYGITKAQAGLAATFFFFSYGVGQIVNGILSDRYNKKWLFPISLMISSVLNLAVFFGTPFFSIKYLWLINGFVQSCLWSGVINVISKTVDEKHINTAMVFMSTTTSFGTIITYSASSLFSFINNYKLSFLFGAVVMTVLGIIWFAIYSTDLEVNQQTKEKTETSSEKKGMSGFLALMIMMGSFALIDNLLKDGLTTWVPDILKQRYTLGDSLSILFTVLLPILGVFGGIISISVVNVMKDFIAVISLFFAIGAVSIGAIAVMPGMPVAVAVIFFGIVVCVMHGVNNIVNTTGPLKMRDKLDAGKMAGIMNGCAYVGSTISSYGLGKVADIGGWQTVLYLLLLICIISVIAGVIYCAAERIKKK